MTRARGHEVRRFLVVGAAGTLAYLVVYLLLRLAAPAQVANVIARLGVAIPTTWFNGRYTFGTRVSRLRLYTGAVGVLAAGTAVSAGLLFIEQSVVGDTERPAELAALLIANVGAAMTRFVVLRNWVFRPMTSGRTAVPERANASREHAGEPAPKGAA